MNKGTVLDLIPIMLVVFISAVGIIAGARIMESVRETYTPSSTTGQGILPKGTHMVNNFNIGFLIFTVGLGLAAVIGAFLITSHPVFFFLSMILVAIILIPAAMYTNVWNSFIINEQVATIGNDFPIITNIMRNFPKIMLGFSALILIAMYHKIRGSY